MALAIIFLILGLLGLGGGVGYLVYTQRVFTKSDRQFLTSKEKLTFALCAAAISIGALFAEISVFLFNPSWQSNADYSYPLYMAMGAIGAFGLAFSNVALWLSFYLYYYKPKMVAPERKFFRYVTFASLPFVLGFFLLWSQGLAPYITYPLVSGFAINESGFQWTRGTWTGSGFHVAWYALIMLFGVCVCYWICDHRFYKEFHKHGILDNLAIFAFICGVVGARIWYVIGNWTRDGFNNDFASVFQVWKGGLTIMGGALGGVIGGLAYLMIRRKYVNPRWAMSVVVPTILLAQAIGRWGNFFNQEVYGTVVNISDGWQWLPLFIQKQMATSDVAAGQIHVPLFLIEGMINLAGYFIIAWGIGKGLKKYLSQGDLAGCYFIWYGAVRMILEPLRDSAYNMGADNAWSVWSSLIYVILGLGLILFDHLLDLKEKGVGGDKPFFIASLILIVVSLFTPFLTGVKGVGYRISGGVITESEAESYMGFNLIFGGAGFKPNVGLIIAYLLLVSGLALAIYVFVKNKDGTFAKSSKLYLGSAGFLGLGVLLFFLAKVLLGLNDGTGNFGGLTSVNINYNLGAGFILTTCLSLIAIALLFIPFLNDKFHGAPNLVDEKTE